MRLVPVVGPKKSGKTTVVERLLCELRRRGLSTGTLKFIHHESFTVHAEARDTARHWEAGADFSLALAPGETALVRRTTGRHETLEELRDLIPSDASVLLCEGLILGGEDVRTIICARSDGEARAFTGELPRDANVIAVSGVGAAGLVGMPDIEVLDATSEDDLRRLADKVQP